MESKLHGPFLIWITFLGLDSEFSFVDQKINKSLKQ